MVKAVVLMAVSLLALVSGAVHAIPSASLTGNGVVWTLNIDSMNNNTASFSLYADVSGSTLGNAYLHEFGLKNFGSNSSISNLSAPAGSWDWTNETVAAQGCQGNGSYDALCVYNAGYFKSAPSTAADFMFSFDVSLDAEDLFPEVLHFTARWVAEKEHRRNSDYRKVGNLISDDFSFTFQPETDPPGKIPEPAIIGLMLTGLLAMFGIRRLKT